MTDATASIYVALIVQIGAIVLWLLQRKRGKRDDDVAWQQRVAELSAELSALWGQRMADRDRELASRDRDLVQKDALIQQLLARGPHD